MFLRDLSFRYKIPLRGTVVILITAFAITAALVFRAYEDLKQDLVLNSESMARVLARTLIAPMIYDDVWRAFEIINSPFQPEQPAHWNEAEIVMVLDARQQIYVSTQPREYPMLTDPAGIHPDYAALRQAIIDYRGFEPTAIDLVKADRIYLLAPIVSDGVSVGTLIMGYSKAIFLPRFYGLVKRAALITLGVLAVLLPLTWYWGRRLAVPLVQLADCMEKIGPHIPGELQCNLYESKDEIGQAGAAFKRMLNDLKEKEALERQMLHSERLAAIGRLSATIAHEINNPLGGMLNAISTYKRHGADVALDAKDLAVLGSEACPKCLLPRRLTLTGKTLSLLERGLMQIKDTVAALLVEAKVESHPLTRQDVEDTHTLVLAAVHDRSAQLAWENDILEPLTVPSTLVRQILINLLLNAIQAIEPGGHVHCRIYRDSGSLYIQVENDGGHIPAEYMKYLFEPFSHLSESGHGLGLWVTYQIVLQLNGEIKVESEPGATRFMVELPLKAKNDSKPLAQAMSG